jgi:hypothetical protein
MVIPTGASASRADARPKHMSATIRAADIEARFRIIAGRLKPLGQFLESREKNREFLEILHDSGSNIMDVFRCRLTILLYELITLNMQLS